MATITYARVISGAVVEVLPALDAETDPAEVFHADIAAQLVVVPAAQVGQVAVGWLETGGADGNAVFAAPSATKPPAELLDYASLRQDSTLAGTFSFNVAAVGAPAHIVTTRLDTRGQFAMLKVQGWLTLNAGRPGALMPYSNVDFTSTALTPAEADSLVEQAAALDAQGYDILNRLSAAITAVPPTVTTFDQIDAAFAALAPVAVA